MDDAKGVSMVFLHRTFYVIQVQKPYRADEDGF